MADEDSPIRAARVEYLVRADRLGRPPLPWTWAIYKAGDGIVYVRGEQFYRSAEDAWAAGTALLLRQR